MGEMWVKYEKNEYLIGIFNLLEYVLYLCKLCKCKYKSVVMVLFLTTNKQKDC